MATVYVATRTSVFAAGLSLGLVAVLAPTTARADDAAPADPAPAAPAPASGPSSAHPAGIEGHIGVATPLVTYTSGTGGGTKSISDQFTLLHPIGIGFKVSPRAAVDFEVVFGNPISPRGGTSLLVDPGIVYDLGPAVIGLRLALPVGATTSYGLIPLVHKGIVDLGGGANWFIEAAFPSFAHFTPGAAGASGTNTVELNVVLHTGIGF